MTTDAFLTVAYAGPAADTTDVGGWTIPVPVTRDTGTYTLADMRQPGTRLIYIAAAGVDSTTRSVATPYYWDGTNIIDESGSTTGAGSVAYGTDPLNPSGPILPYATWNYCCWKQNGEEIGGGGSVTTEYFRTGIVSNDRLTKPDWILFKRGETFDIGATFGANNNGVKVPGGAAAGAEQVVTSYGSTATARAKLIRPVNGFITRSHNAIANYITYRHTRILGLEFDGHDRSGTTYTTTWNGHLSGAVNNLVEDCYWNGAGAVSPKFSAGQIKFRRCLAIENFQLTGTPQGFAVNTTPTEEFTLQIEDCIVAHCGFKTQDPATAWPPSGGTLDWDIFSRNFYLTAQCVHKDSYFRNNVDILGASGSQFRNGMRVEGCFFYTGYVILNGHGGDAQPNSGLFRNNVVQCYRATTGTTAAHPSWGLILGHAAQGVRVDGNIFTRAQCGRTTSNTSSFGINLKPVNDDNYYALTRALQDNTITDNVFDCGVSAFGVQIEEAGRYFFGVPNPGLTRNKVVLNVFAYSAGTLLTNVTPPTGIGSPCGAAKGYPGSYANETIVQATLGQGAPIYGTNTGNGTLTLLAAVGTPPTETWTITFTSATEATVVGSVSGAQTSITALGAYSNAYFSLTLTAGAAAWIAGDYWTFTTYYTISANDTYCPTTGAVANRTYATMAAAATTEGYLNEDYTLKVYAQDIGMTITTGDGEVEYVAAARLAKRGSWPRDLTAKGIVNGFRYQFNKPALA